MDGTIAENISRFDPDADSKTIIQAARAASVHELILRLPDGYETQIGPDGAVLSAGQRQRIALARALYGNPFIVVMDEPNANLDGEGDAALTRAIQSIRERQGIAVVIAHRPSALQAVNLIALIHDGLLKDFGPKQEVLQKLSPRPVSSA
jgi:ATP-binding cassette subfamily C protein